MPLVYQELRRIAASYLASERPDHTLQATALVHEAYLKLVDLSRMDWRGRSHFRAVASQAMRRILVDHARERGALKRGGGLSPVTLGDSLVPAPGSAFDPADLVSLDQAMGKLAGLDPRQAKVLELRLFGGLTVAEIAEVLGVSKRTVEGDWTHGRAWLRLELSEGGGP